jgi:hypothetical protein
MILLNASVDCIAKVNLLILGSRYIHASLVVLAG